MAGRTPAAPAVGAATISPMAAFTSSVAMARDRIDVTRSPMRRGPSAKSRAARPPVSPDGERTSPFRPSSTALRMTLSVFRTRCRISSPERPLSATSSARTVSGSDRSDSRADSSSAAMDLCMGRSGARGSRPGC